jgi:hypothetical protein
MHNMMYDILISITQGSQYDLKAIMHNCRFKLLLLSLSTSQHILTLRVEGSYEYAAEKDKKNRGFLGLMVGGGGITSLP